MSVAPGKRPRNDRAVPDYRGNCHESAPQTAARIEPRTVKTAKEIRSMAIHVACPLCHQQLELPDQFAGRTVRCRKCKDWFIAGSAPVVCHEALPPKSVGTRQSPKIRQPDLREQPTEPVRLKC